MNGQNIQNDNDNINSSNLEIQNGNINGLNLVNFDGSKINMGG